MAQNGNNYFLIDQPQEGIMVVHWNGRLGNRMHTYAYCSEYARKYGVDFLLPSDWEGTHFFQNQKHQVLKDDLLRKDLNQTAKNLDTLEFKKSAISRFNERTGSSFEFINPDNPSENWNNKKSVFIDSLCAYNKSIWPNMSAKVLKEDTFALSDKIKNLELYKKLEDKQGTYDIAHLRRDDISNPSYNKSNVQGYSVLSKKAYQKAFKKFGFDGRKMKWVSDDYSKKWHKSRKAESRFGWRYPEGAEYREGEVPFDWLEDFLKLYFARTVFRANSSFSWWACFLSNTAKTYSPKIDKQFIYGRDNDGEEKEIEYEFEEGNGPHWMHGNDYIIFGE